MSTTPPTQSAEDGATLRRSASALIAPGAIIASRYEVRRLLGRGAMGEVWLAFDLKLRVEVALKDLTFRQEDREMLRREVRAARDVISPNVCRVFDLVEAEQRELLSMEHVDGVTLWQVIEERSPLDVSEAQTIASQLLAGLESIHNAGLVHRDIKPENVMITRTGRVVIMDFGLARESRLDSGSIAGTPPYMSPEQARGDSMDPRTDLFAVGVVLAEMISGARTREARHSIWEGIRRRPVEVPDNAWSPVLRRALACERSERFASAREMARALEEVTTRLAAAEERSPYPGLAAFTSDQSRFFFGREAEVETMLRKLERYPMLALIGPSGAGKSSFLNAGVLPMLPKSWGVLLCHPGSSPFVSLGQVVAAQLNDPAMGPELVRFHEVDGALSVLRRWRSDRDEALLVIDQFEELFTLNTPETQARFAELLGRVAAEEQIRVLLSMRDDFLFHCHRYDALAPVFLDLTPLDAPASPALRRALVQPAVLSGYTFEYDSLIDQMVEEVGSGRGSLPLLSFAAAQLWQRRDRQAGLLTRKAYEDIGGVSGALAQHAEATLERIGRGRIAIVRELFRNLVTAQGTRASLDREELLSVFGTERTQAEEVLNILIAARLLISFENRIEIAHESLLVAWPRLGHWQAQDAEGALMRDHLRQAARLWEERGRPRELLWTGNAYREFLVWRSRYTGALSSAEEVFAKAMVSYVERRTRSLRAAAAAMFAVMIAVAAVLAVLWKRSELSAQRARDEARRAEAQKLLALSRVELDEYPTAALAYATKSLEFADTPDARYRVMEILWRGPIARVVPVAKTTDVYVTFSRDGKWLAALSAWGSDMLIPSDGTAPRRLQNPPGIVPSTFFSDDGKYIAVGAGDDRFVRVFSIADGKLVRTADDTYGRFVAGESVITVTPDRDRTVVVRSWPFAGGEPVTLQRSDSAIWENYLSDLRPETVRGRGLHPNGTSFAFAQDAVVYRRGIRQPTTPPKPVWSVGEKVLSVSLDGPGETFTAITSERIRVRRRDGTVRTLERSTIGPEAEPLGRDLKSAKIVLSASPDRVSRYFVWDLDGPSAIQPVELRAHPSASGVTSADMHPKGTWVATAGPREVAFWPLAQPHARIIPSRVGGAFSAPILFTPDSRHLLSCGNQGGFNRWSLRPEETSAHLLDFCLTQAVDRVHSRFIAAGNKIFLLSQDGGPPRTLLELPVGTYAVAAAFHPSMDLAAVYRKEPQEAAPREIKVFDLHSGNIASLPVETFDAFAVRNLAFAFDGALYSAGNGGIRRWDLTKRKVETFRPAQNSMMAMSGNGRFILAAFGGSRWGRTDKVGGDLILFDLERSSQRRITTHGSDFHSLAIDETGNVIATKDASGIVRVGKASGGQPHVLLNGGGGGGGLAISPDGKWVATRTESNIVLWPMPDLSETPLHVLPHDQLVSKLHNLTNLRAVADQTSSTGYKVEIGPFPGWKDAPTW